MIFCFDCSDVQGIQLLLILWRIAGVIVVIVRFSVVRDCVREGTVVQQCWPAVVALPSSSCSRQSKPPLTPPDNNMEFRVERASCVVAGACLLSSSLLFASLSSFQVEMPSLHYLLVIVPLLLCSVARLGHGFCKIG